MERFKYFSFVILCTSSFRLISAAETEIPNNKVNGHLLLSAIKVKNKIIEADAIEVNTRI